MNRYISALVVVALIALSSADVRASIVNGDFELGNTGFTSQYVYNVPTTGLGQYAVAANPNSVHPSWYSFGDHTSGSGVLMMIVNGASDADLVVWSQNVTLTAGTIYEFRAWGTGVYPAAPGNLSFKI